MGRVMVINDEPDLRLALRLFLERNGHRVEEAGSGEDVLGKLNQIKPDLLLLDTRMPGLDGLQTLARIRESHQSLPIILMTGYASQQAASDAYQMGASHYLAKPFKHEELLEAMTHLGVGSRATRTERAEPDPRDPTSFVPGIVAFIGRVRGLWTSFNQLLYMTQEEFLVLEENLPDPYRQELSFLDKAVNYIGLMVELVRYFYRGLCAISWDPPPVEEMRRHSAKASPAEPEHQMARHKIIPGMDFRMVERPHPSAPVSSRSPASSGMVLPKPVEHPVGLEEKKVMPAASPPKPSVAPVPIEPRGLQESPQEELHRLLIKVQTVWDQHMSALGKDLSGDLHVLDDCSRTIQDLRRFVGPSEQDQDSDSDHRSNAA